MRSHDYDGYLDAASDTHVSGWILNRAQVSERARHQVFLENSGEILVDAVADLFVPGLREIGVGDGAHGFYHKLPRRLDPAEHAQLQVRVSETGLPLKRPEWMARTYQPIVYIVMDIVDNCNLRCPFCLYDYSGVHKTNMMTEETMDAALRFAPYASDGAFWFSCLHEPTMHPRFTEYLRKMPREHRRTIFYTSNLARRMPGDYYAFLADSGVHHINVSIESLDPAIYERMRKGSRHRIFKENWDQMLEAFNAGSAPPRLRYIVMAYKSNFKEIPRLAEHLLNERRGAEVEVRYTYDEPHIAEDFRKAEYLDDGEWLWLRDQLAPRLGSTIMLSMPPGVEARAAAAQVGGRSRDSVLANDAPGEKTPAGERPSPAGAFLPGRYGLRLTWDGSLDVSRYWIGEGQPGPDATRLVKTNVRDILDVDAFLAGLPI
jgi:pyruvate-formate lyase-activating enzyme